MARKSYAARNAESIAKTGRSLYERRIASSMAKGKSRQAARGHTRDIKPPKPPLPEVNIRNRPTVKKKDLPEELQGLPRVIRTQGGNKVYSARSEGAALKAIQEAARLGKRVVITVYSANTKESHVIYVSPLTTTRFGEGATAQWILDEMEANDRSLDEQLEYDYSRGSCGPLPELGNIGLYTIETVDTPARAA